MKHCYTVLTLELTVTTNILMIFFRQFYINQNIPTKVNFQVSLVCRLCKKNNISDISVMKIKHLNYFLNDCLINILCKLELTSNI